MTTLRLSEAIRMNGMMKPQGFGLDSFYSSEAPCALGGALQSIGQQLFNVNSLGNFELVKSAWPFVKGLAACPACQRCNETYTGRSRYIYEVIWLLNDVHKWTRSQIADWVEMIELTESSSDELLAAVAEKMAR